MGCEQENPWIWFVNLEKIRPLNLEDKFLLGAEKQTHQYVWLPSHRDERAQNIVSWCWEENLREVWNLKKKKLNWQKGIFKQWTALQVNFSSLTAIPSSEPWGNFQSLRCPYLNIRCNTFWIYDRINAVLLLSFPTPQHHQILTVCLVLLFQVWLCIKKIEGIGVCRHISSP